MDRVRNYQKELEKIIEGLYEDDAVRSDIKPNVKPVNPPSLLLHSCCAPCSSYVLEYLRKYFKITVFYYNPNISPDIEYRKRVEEQKRLIAAYNEELSLTETVAYPIDVIEGDYEPDCFFTAVKGLESCPEGGERCFVCYELRLRKTSQIAAEGGYDYFTTTLTISPLKNAAKLNEIGEALSARCGVSWLPSDFKKKDGYKRSIELSEKYGLYRQNYCGCVYSVRGV